VVAVAVLHLHLPAQMAGRAVAAVEVIQLVLGVLVIHRQLLHHKVIMAAIIFQIIRHLQMVVVAVVLERLAVMQQLLLLEMAVMERLLQLAVHLSLMLAAVVVVLMPEELLALEVRAAAAMRMAVQVRQIRAAAAQEP
jgi:hypothetical protein